MEGHYRIALDAALEWISSQYTPIGVIVSGSIVRGNPNANSDFDIFVIHADGFRQRVPLPRIKERVRELLVPAPEVGTLVEGYYLAEGRAARLEAARRLVVVVVGETGFFEWASERD